MTPLLIFVISSFSSYNFFSSFHYTCITRVHVVIQEKISFSLGKLPLLRDIKVEETYSDHEHATPTHVGLVDEGG